MENEGKDLKFDPEADPPWHPDMPQKNKPVYTGFWVDKEVDTDGFKIGLITEPEISDGEEYGDAFLVAPDNSRCGLIYEVGEAPDREVCIEPEEGRWGVWNVTVTNTMTTDEGRRKNLVQLVAMLRGEWENWKKGSR